MVRASLGGCASAVVSSLVFLFFVCVVPDLFLAALNLLGHVAATSPSGLRAVYTTPLQQFAKLAQQAEALRQLWPARLLGLVLADYGMDVKPAAAAAMHACAPALLEPEPLHLLALLWLNAVQPLPAEGTSEAAEPAPASGIAKLRAWAADPGNSHWVPACVGVLYAVVLS